MAYYMRYPRNVGVFYVPFDFFNDLAPGEGANLFKDMVVLRAEELLERQAIRYIAVHPQFRQREMGEMVPGYAAEFKDGATYPTWVPTNQWGF